MAYFITLLAPEKGNPRTVINLSKDICNNLVNKYPADTTVAGYNLPSGYFRPKYVHTRTSVDTVVCKCGACDKQLFAKDVIVTELKLRDNTGWYKDHLNGMKFCHECAKTAMKILSEHYAREQKENIQLSLF